MKDLSCLQTILIIAGIWLAYSFIFYRRDQIEKVKVFGRKYIAVYLKDGTCIEYEGFCFIVKTYKIKIDPIVQKS